MFQDPSGLTEEEIQQLIAMGVIPDQQDAIGQQMAQAQALRHGPGPQGRQTNAAFVAANPLEFVGDFMTKRDAAKDIEDLKRQQEELLRQRTEGMGVYYNAKFGVPRPTATTPPIAPTPFRGGR